MLLEVCPSTEAFLSPIAYCLRCTPVQCNCDKVDSILRKVQDMSRERRCKKGAKDEERMGYDQESATARLLRGKAKTTVRIGPFEP